MPSKDNEEKLSKYDALLDLALAQIDAIEAHDQKLVNQIMERKWALIRSLSGTKELLAEEPKLAGIIKQIQEADQLAEIKLKSRMSDVRERISKINKRTVARQAYGQAGRKKHPLLGLVIDDNTPRFFDIQT